MLTAKNILLIFLSISFIVALPFIHSQISKNNGNERGEIVYKSEIGLSLDLNITKKEGFESYLNIDIERLGNGRFRIDYEYDKNASYEIKEFKDKKKNISVLKDGKFKDIKDDDLKISLDNFENTDVINLTPNIRTDRSKINLSSSGSIYVYIPDYDPEDINKSAGRKIKIGYNTVEIETISTFLLGIPIGDSIALDSNGISHISYVQSGFLAYGLRYCNNTASIWSCSNVKSISGTIEGGTSIAVDSNNRLHISYYNSSFGLSYCNNTISTFSNWNCTTIDSGNGVGKYSSIAIDNGDRVHIAYSNTTSSDLRYCNNTLGSWTCSIISPGTYYLPSLAIGTDNISHISVANSTNKRNIFYCNNTASIWSCSNITNGICKSSSIALDNNNKVHIAYQCSSGHSIGYANNTLGIWTSMQAFALGSNPKKVSIAVDRYNKPHISFIDSTFFIEGQNDIRYAKELNGWDRITIQSSLSNQPNYTISDRFIAVKKGRIVDSNSYSDRIHITYYNHSATHGYLVYSRINPYVDSYLNSPSNNTIHPALTTFNCSAISLVRPLSNITVYVWNSSGSIYNQTTNNASGTGILNNTLFNITFNSEGDYNWNCFAESNESINAFNLTNRTVTIDLTKPNITINSITNSRGNLVFNFNATSSDTNLGSCKYSVYNSTGGIDKSIENVSYSCNTTISNSTSNFGNYNLTLHANDSAGNENITTQLFSIQELASASSAGGGGGRALAVADFRDVTALIKHPDDIRNYTITDRAVIFSRIFSYVNQFGDDLRTFDRLKILEMIFEDVKLNTNEMDLWIEQFINERVEIVRVSSSLASSLNLILTDVKFSVSPGKKVEENRFVISPNFFRLQNYNFNFSLLSNYNLKECEVISGANFTCDIDGSQIIIGYKESNFNFLTKTKSSTIEITNIRDNNLFIDANFQIWNFGLKILWVPLYAIIGIGGIGGYSFYYFRKRRKR